MFGLREKLSLGFGGLLVTLLVVSGLGVAVLARYRTSLDTFLKENWRSVEYGRHVIESVEKLDEITGPLGSTPSGTQLAAAARTADGPITVAESNCTDEDHNITLDGEQKLAADLTLAWSGKSLDGKKVTADCYRDAVATLLDPHVTGTDRTAATAAVHRLSQVVRSDAQKVIDLNVANMRPVDGRAKQMADRAMLLMVAGAAAGTGLAVVFTLLVARSILRPLKTVIRSIREIEQGNLDLVVQVKSRDEIRQLAEAFNSMAAKLREYRRTSRAKLLRTQQTTQLAVNSLVDAVAVTGPDGKIELSNDSARRLFGLDAGVDLATVGDRRLVDVYREVAASGQPSKPRGYESAVEVYDGGGQLKFFLPHAVPISDGDARPIGVTLVLADVTNLRKLDEMKSGLLSVVSHELKTPLTSIRMAVHLLLEERVGPLTPKQVELMTAAREDSDRLDKIIAGLLDMGRMESGQADLHLEPQQADRLIDEAVNPLATAFHDKGIAVDVEVKPDLPAVMADADRVGHVFTNLLTNALKFTDPGGKVRITAEPDGEKQVRFTVADTGVGIPAEYLPRVFDRFFRVPSDNPTNGAGLGLAIAREIVRAHGGDIDVKSDADHGTSFGFSLAGTGGDAAVRS
jgi:NtrC-family two-component system sensor histidine kinase KinB